MKRTCPHCGYEQSEPDSTTFGSASDVCLRCGRPMNAPADSVPEKETGAERLSTEEEAAPKKPQTLLGKIGSFFFTVIYCAIGLFVISVVKVGIGACISGCNGSSERRPYVQTGRYSSGIRITPTSFNDLVRNYPKTKWTTELLRKMLDNGVRPDETFLLPEPFYLGMKAVVEDLRRSVYRQQEMPAFRSRHEIKMTPLQMLSFMGNDEGVRMLLNAGADPNRETNFYFATPLQLAVMAQNPDLVDCLLRHGANPDIKTFLGTALNCAASSWKGQRESRKKHFSHLDGLSTDERMKPMLKAAMTQPENFFFPDDPETEHINLKIIMMLLSANASMDGRDAMFGTHPIVAAMAVGNIKGAEMLIGHCSDLESVEFTKNGVRMPLASLAAYMNQGYILKLLFDRGISPLTRSSDGTPLHKYAKTEELQDLIMHYLLKEWKRRDAQ